MATTITIKLNKDASVFQAGESQGFGIRGGVQYYDRETRQKEWTNYEAAIFAKPGPQADFYAQTLLAGSVVEVTCKQLKIKSFDGTNSTMLSLEMIDASLGMIHTAQAAPQQGQAQGGYNQPQPQPQPQQGGYAPAPQNQPYSPPQRPAPQQQAPVNQGQGLPPNLDDGWDKDIPF
jgi:single-strand DNA-binding protein